MVDVPFLPTAPQSASRAADAFKITQAYEAGDWCALGSIAGKLGYPEAEVAERLLHAASRASALST
jgi:hypothetical protein